MNIYDICHYYVICCNMCHSLAHLDVDVQLCHLYMYKNALSFECFSLCLSRACLGKTSNLSIEMDLKRRFRCPARSPRARPARKHLLSHLFIENDHFTKTGSGQT